ncbi:MAG TPA: FAD-dependent oxidoreductase [Clostridia bacterium]
MKNLQFINEPARDIPVLAKVDVVVVGGGPAGLSAAIMSARMGMETILVERYGCFGGNITVCAVEPPSWYRMPKTVESKTVVSELEDRCVKKGASQPCMHNPPGIGMSHDADMFKVCCDELVEENKVEPLLHCWGAYPIMEGDEIKGVFTESKSGRQAILAKRVIDCTGDGDIAAHAGVPYDKGDAFDGRMMGTTMVFGISGVDVGLFRQYVSNFSDTVNNIYTLEGLWQPFDKAIKNNDFDTKPRYDIKYNQLTTAGEATAINGVGQWDGSFDCTNVRDLTREEIHLRKRVLYIIETLKKYQAGFEKARLRNFAMAIGCRESRRIKGEYSISRFDTVQQARFVDSIGVFPVHSDGLGTIIIPDTDAYFEVPYGISVPKKVENLLVAGRCISGTRASVATTREMNFCSITGQGAGVAAAISIRDKVTPRSVDIEKVQSALIKHDIRVH